jgi:hypothetical protein
VAAGTKDGVDMIAGGQEALRLTRRFELPHDLFPLLGQTVRIFNSVVQAFAGSMISFRCQVLYRLDRAAQLDRACCLRSAFAPNSGPDARYRGTDGDIQRFVLRPTGRWFECFQELELKKSNSRAGRNFYRCSTIRKVPRASCSAAKPVPLQASRSMKTVVACHGHYRYQKSATLPQAEALKRSG